MSQLLLQILIVVGFGAVPPLIARHNEGSEVGKPKQNVKSFEF